MSTAQDQWKIRFAQIFQSFLKESGKRLEDHLFLLPMGVEVDARSEKSFERVDLHANRPLYEQYFSQAVPPAPALDRETAKRLNTTVVVVPGFGYHLIRTKVFEEQGPLLQELGFPYVYADYGDSLESNEKCAKRLADIIERDVDARTDIVLLGYSKGAVISVEMLGDPQYEKIAARTKAVVSVAGALRGSPHASSQAGRAAVKLLEAYRAIRKPMSFGTRLVRWGLRSLSWLPVRALREARDLLDKVADFQDDLADLPDGILDLSKQRARIQYSEKPVPASVKLFSLSAVCPEEVFTRGIRFISNPDDLFLYVSGRELYDHHVFNDTQVLLPDSKFFDNTGTIIDLGMVKADHWGITMSRVLSKTHTDPFPRTELLKSILVTLDEYFRADQ